MVDAWNATNFEINGSISARDIISYENAAVTPIERVAMK
jgi:hypothetical protein